MGAKLVASLAGFVVSTPFLAGVFNSNSKLSDSLLVSHSWSAQPMESFDVSYTCVNNKVRSSEEFGKFVVKVGKEELNKEKDKLAKKQDIKVGIKFEFQVNNMEGGKGISLLEGGKKAYMTVNRKYDGGLWIKLSRDKGSRVEANDVRLDCQLTDRGQVSEVHGKQTVNDVFMDWVTFDMSKRALKLESGKGTANVSVFWCNSESSEARTCDLKVSDTAGRKWSVKVPKKLNLTPSK